MMMKISSDTLKLINSLSEKKKGKVEAIVRRHVAACLKNGFDPENMERAYIEAMEMVELEEKFPEPTIEEDLRNWEPARRYEQYVSPKAA
ncbi:MAG: hypothetical protein IPL01_17585 [Acidobacteria bacterium]|nr:hypothetical protein [Acidobacteriota bacterium]MBK8315715.1 hypothetical protein [Acidobacteriota bacterium]